MRSKKQMAPVVIWFFLATTGVSAAEQPVSVNTSDRFSMAPIGRTANVSLVVRIDRHEGNRNIDVDCEGIDEGLYARSGKSLEGDRERKTFTFAFNLTPATYRCEAVLKRKMNGKIREFKDSLELTVK